MFEVGSILINRNIVFKGKDKLQLDHAYKKGRPCLVIAMDDDYYYYLSISHCDNPNRKSRIDENCVTKLCSPSFANIFRAPICFKSPVSKISDSNLLNIYKEFIKYYENNEKCMYYDKVIQYMNDFINKYDNKKTK